MKKIFILVFSYILIVFSSYSVSANSFTEDIATNVEYEYLPNGDYYKIETNIASNYYTRSTATFSRTKTYVNASDKPQWYIKVTATFQYNGVTSSCTKVTSDAEAYTSQWKIISHSSSKKGNSGTAKATAKRYMAGIPVETMNGSVTISCDAKGNII